MKKRKIFVFNGPNLNMLGTREPGMYGTDSLSDLLRMLKRYAKERGVVIRAYQSNHEGRLIDRIHALAGKDIFGIIINPAINRRRRHINHFLQISAILLNKVQNLPCAL